MTNTNNLLPLLLLLLLTTTCILINMQQILSARKKNIEITWSYSPQASSVRNVFLFTIMNLKDFIVTELSQFTIKWLDLLDNKSISQNQRTFLMQFADRKRWGYKISITNTQHTHSQLLISWLWTCVEHQKTREQVIASWKFAGLYFIRTYVLLLHICYIIQSNWLMGDVVATDRCVH